MSVSAFPYGTIAAAGSGQFLLDLNNDAFLATDSNGNSVTGQLKIFSDGSITWTGDTLGTNESGMTWWDPVGSPSGTWHTRIDFQNGIDILTGSQGVWISTASTVTWTFFMGSSGQNGGRTRAGQYLLSFSNDGGSTTYDSVLFQVTLLEDTI